MTNEDSNAEPTKTEGATAPESDNANAASAAPAEGEGGEAQQQKAEPARELTLDEARALLAWCRENPAADDALETLTELRDHLLRPELAGDVIAASEAVTATIVGETSPRPAAHALMTILLAYLVSIESQRDRVDAIFLAWMRNPATFGSDRATPPMFQRGEFVQRVADLLGWGSLELPRDREVLGRFFAWVNSWTTKNKFRVRRTVEAMRRNWPAPDVWGRVHYPPHQGRG